MLAGKRIIIAGGGIGGLATAIALRNASVKQGLSPLPSVTVYERDSGLTSRADQGYSLSIRGDGNGGGYQALFDLGVLQALLDDAEPGGSMTMREHDFAALATFGQVSTATNSGVTKTGDATSSKAGAFKAPARDSGHGMRIARPALRKGLYDGALAAGATVEWSKTIVGIRSVEAKDGVSHTVVVEMSDGTTVECDYFIVADGSRSRIRTQLLPSEVLRYAGAFTLATAVDVDKKDGIPFPLDGGANSVFGLNGINSFMAPTHKGTQGLVAMTQLSDQPVAEVKGHINPKHEVDDALAQLQQMWRDGGFPQSGPMYALVQRAGAFPERITRFNAWDKLPHRYSQYSAAHPHVIFIGDSCHPMSPFAGNGANMALMDAVTIGRLLSALKPLSASGGGDARDAHIKQMQAMMAAYEAEMIPRATKAIEFSHMMIGWHVKSWHQRMWRNATARAFGLLLNHPKKVAFGLGVVVAAALGYAFREPLGRAWTSAANSLKSSSTAAAPK